MTHYKPIIVINLCTRTTDDMFYIRRGYLEALRKAGAIPIGLPLMADPDYAARVIDIADGVLLPGSLTDVDPRYYGAEVSPYFGEKGPERDASDFYLLEKAFERKMPVFGICYGHQSLNVFCGGTLYQDIQHELNSNIKHWQSEPYYRPVHKIAIVDESSLVYRVFRKKEMEVNSIHHQAIKSLGKNLKPTAYSPDGLIEAYESVNGGQFVIGVQWHPERMWEQHPEHLGLFEEFVAQARQWHQKNK